jgi:gliding motility-associated-like protein
LAQNQTAKTTPTSSIHFWEYLPPDYNANSNNYPVVFFLHGLGERGDNVADLSAVTRNGPPKHVKAGYKFPFILISPQLKTRYTDWPPTYVDEVIEYAKTYLRIDPSRIYLTGLSLGGGGTWWYAQDPVYVKKLAAIAVICGSRNTPSKACTLANTNLPVWAFHGDRDGTVNFNKTVSMVNAINACVPAPNPLAIMTIYPGVNHNSWDNAYRTDNSLHTPNVYQWLMGFKNGGISVSAGTDITVNLPTNSATITGTASTEAGSITSYAWTKVSGPAVTIANASTPTVSLTNLVQGVYVFRLTVTNSGGETATDDVRVTVLQVNQAPTANAGSDAVITLPTNSLNLNGSGSDTDGTIASYAWVKVSGPTATIGGANTATLLLSNLLQGTYVFSLTVTDNLGATATDQVTVTVNPAAVNQPPTANAGIDKTVNLPTNSTNLAGTGSDPDGTVTSYLWEKTSGPTVTLTNANTATASLANLVAGIYTFRLTVTDNLGATGTDLVTVTVVAANQSPVANAGSDINVTLPLNTTTIIGSGTDPDGSITTYAWTQVSGPTTATLANAGTSTLTASDLAEGVYSFRLTVTDDKGSTGFDDVSVTVNAAPPNVAPTANAGADKTVNLPTNSTNLVGSGTDTDGTITAYLWEKVSGPGVTIANATSSTVSISNLLEGVYVFQLTVTDNQGATGTDQTTVIVAATNQSPTANAGANITITLPTNSTTINGSGTDPDGTIATYAWSQENGPATATLANPGSSTLSVSDLVEGTYTFRLTVTDDDGSSAFDDVNVIVNGTPVNSAPTANAGADKTIALPANSTVLNGTGTDTDGTIASYAWTLTSGPTATLTNENTANLTASDLVAGTYIFTLTVTDDDGATDEDDVTVTVQPDAVNEAPVANAGSDVVLTLPTSTTTLNGGGTDADGTIASYEWVKASGPAATLTDENTATLQLSDLVQGVYVFQLTVTDDQGASDLDEVTVTVNAANTPPTANAGADITINLPVNFTDITGAGTDADGSIISYSWTQVSGPNTATLANSTASTLTASDMIAGTYVFRLTVEDDDNATGTDDVKVVVNAANQTPTANAGIDKTITLPTSTANFNGTGSDTDGTITSYAWTQVSGPSATMSNAGTQTLSVTASAEGTYVFRLTVRDDGGAEDFDDVTLTVNPAAVNQAPTADAGANQSITLPVNTLTLTGTGSDPDGSIATYKWLKLSGPTAVLTNANSATVTLSSLVEGTYTFRLIVTDNGGLTGVDHVTVTVSPAVVNQIPIADAGTDKTITLPTNSITLAGSGSDADGTIAAYAWTQVSGPAATMANGNTPNLSLSSLTDGVYVFRLTVTDNNGATDTDDVRLTVNPAAVNQAPVANAGPNQNITLPVNSLTLSGSGSDADGAIATYQWIKVSGPAATLANGNTAQLSLSNLVEGAYVFRLTVTDNGGLSDTDDVNVTVLPAAVNQPPTANAGTDKTITLPTNTLTLFGSGSDPDGTVLTYTWTKVSGGAATLTNANTPSLTLSDLVAGTYVFRLTVTDEDNATDTDEVTVLVNPAATNELPVANAGADKTITLPTNIANLNGSGSDNDGSIVRYAWLKVSGPSVTLGATNAATLSISNLVEGTYVFRLEVEDDDGATDTDDVTVTVLPQIVNQVPSVNAGVDQVIFLPTSTVTLSGSASDPDGGIASYLWTQVAGAAVTLTNAATPTLDVSNITTEGVYRFRLTVTDNASASSFDEATVTVNAATANKPPVANAGPDVTIKLPANSTNLAGAGTDEDGTIATYSWVKVSGPAATMTGADAATLSLTNLVEGTYQFRLTVTDNSGDADTDLTIVTVLPASINLAPVVNAGADVALELPDNSTTLTASATDDGSISGFLWEKISGPAQGDMTGTTTNTLSLSNLVEGNYIFRCTATDDGGLTDYDDVAVNVSPAPDNLPPVVDAGEDQIIQLPVNTISVTAQAESPNGLIVSYRWEQTLGTVVPVDPDTATTLNISDLDAGAYGFRVTVTDGAGLTASDDLNVTVLEGEPFAKPQNLFSPDSKGDLNTETWTIENPSLLDGCEIVVFNRQGQKVYSSIGYPVPWDGTFNGKPLPDGAYFYVIRCDGQKSKTGSVTIARLK